MKKRLLLCALLSGCASEKLAAKDAFAPVLVIHTVPEGSEVFRGGQSMGKAPLELSLTTNDPELQVEARRDAYLASKVTLDLAGLRKAGGGEAWIALKPDTMGTDTPDLDGLSPKDLDKGGNALTKAKRCDDALQFYERALAVDPGFARAHKDRAKCLAAKKQFDQAATELERYLMAAPDAPDAVQVRTTIDKLHGHRDIEITKKSEDDE